MTLLKTTSFAGVHFAIAFTVVYLMTGSAFIGGAVALIEPACNTVAYFFHEKLWQRIDRIWQQNSQGLTPLLAGMAGFSE